jgi:hypothetical protein
MRVTLLLLSTVLALVPNVLAQPSTLSEGSFFVPPNSEGSNSSENAFANITQWTVGQQVTIQYTTTYQTYTIDIYQQSLENQSATAGPTIYSE